MKVEDKIIELKRELKSLKASYAQVPVSLVLYTYELDIDTSDLPFLLDMMVTIRTENGSNTIAVIEGATYDRAPYEGGARFILYRALGGKIKVVSMQPGTVTME